MHAYDGEVEWEKGFFPFRAYWNNGWVLGYSGVSMNLSKNCSDLLDCQIFFFKLVVCPESFLIHLLLSLPTKFHLWEPALWTQGERQHFLVHWGSCLVTTFSNAFISRFGGLRTSTMSPHGSFRKRSPTLIFCFCCYRRNRKGTSSSSIPLWLSMHYIFDVTIMGIEYNFFL